MIDPRYPIGPFKEGPAPDSMVRIELLSQLAGVPSCLRNAVADLSESQLDTPYRSGGWTLRQVVHHLADAQLNWYLRTKLAITEDQPLVKPYDEAQWAELLDARRAPLEPSFKILEGVHQRWVQLMRSLSEEQWKRKIIHPDRGVFVLDAALAMHVWHGRHHTAQIVDLRNRMGWW